MVKKAAYSRLRLLSPKRGAFPSHSRLSNSLQTFGLYYTLNERLYQDHFGFLAEFDSDALL
jgi:hypothetical protein